MIYNVNELRKDTVELIKTVNMQIAEVEAEAARLGVPANKLRDASDNWLLNPLLLAKAMAYNTLVMLQANERPAARPGGSARRQ